MVSERLALMRSALMSFPEAIWPSHCCAIVLAASTVSWPYLPMLGFLWRPVLVL